ncbi:hypothetical protein DFH28DRAFT_985700 [Melampsora americana]|nr:hypothetical protein DFH28DRAFT_985700 [Melampsora americana]
MASGGDNGNDDDDDDDPWSLGEPSQKKTKKVPNTISATEDDDGPGGDSGAFAPLPPPLADPFRSTETEPEQRQFECDLKFDHNLLETIVRSVLLSKLLLDSRREHQKTVSILTSFKSQTTGLYPDHAQLYETYLSRAVGIVEKLKLQFNRSLNFIDEEIKLQIEELTIQHDHMLTSSDTTSWDPKPIQRCQNSSNSQGPPVAPSADWGTDNNNAGNDWGTGGDAGGQNPGRGSVSGTGTNAGAQDSGWGSRSGRGGRGGYQNSARESNGGGGGGDGGGWGSGNGDGGVSGGGGGGGGWGSGSGDGGGVRDFGSSGQRGGRGFGGRGRGRGRDGFENDFSQSNKRGRFGDSGGDRGFDRGRGQGRGGGREGDAGDDKSVNQKPTNDTVNSGWGGNDKIASQKPADDTANSSWGGNDKIASQPIIDKGPDVVKATAAPARAVEAFDWGDWA